MAKKEPKCIFKGWEYPDGTLYPEPPEEFIERVNRAFQVEHELSLEKQLRSNHQ